MTDDETNDELITISEACRLIGGNESPIHEATFYRGVRAGRYPPPVHPSPGISRVYKGKVRAAVQKIVSAAGA